MNSLSPGKSRNYYAEGKCYFIRKNNLRIPQVTL
jgi:hypothetical protein